MIPPTSIDGTDITGATIDGQDVQEITVDGDTVFTAGPDIPDPDDLIFRYDARSINASDGDPITSWSDSSNAGNDLSGGSPTYKTNQIGGQPVLRFDGTDDFLEATFGSTFNTPNTIFFLIEFQSFSTSAFESVFSDNTNGVSHRFQQPKSNNLRMVNGNSILGGTPDTSAHIITTLYDGSNSEARQDGTQIISGDAGTNALNGFGIGAEADNVHANFDVLEVLAYDGDKSAKFSEIEQFLDRDTSLL
jgi:hypothetical protein